MMQKLINNTVLFLSIVFLFGCGDKKAKTQIGERKPNVLFIAVDDLRTELNCYGASHIQSPNIDRLASEGVRFTNAHVQQAVCMASRASIMSGIRPEHKGLFSSEPIDLLMPDVLTMNKFFKQNGYNISAVGKTYHYGIDRTKQWGDDYIKSKKTWTGKGFVTQESIDKTALNLTYNRGPAYEVAKVHDTIYEDGINALNAVRKLEALAKDDTPFFMAVGFRKPHLPFTVPQKYWDMYSDASIKLPEVSKRPKNASKYTVRGNGEIEKYYGVPATYAEFDDEMTLELRHAYYACVSYIDAQVGLLLNQLDELGLRENTIIVLWGDHGYKLGDYDSWCKWSNMNIDTNIPYIFSVPGGKKGAVCNTAVEALDMYPTMAELCGLEKPEHVEGISIVRNLENPEKEENRYIGTIWPRESLAYDKTIMGYSVKDNRYNYVEWVKLNTGEVLEKELYDHEKDPMETRNVINEEVYKDVVAEMAKICVQRKESTDHKYNKPKEVKNLF
tara:strand:- start:177 stop:1682 length:1506 start_codon:yes stop_codon:yes gene_type:complete